MTPEEYLEALHLALVECAAVESYAIIRQRAASDSGYLRVRIRLVNGDFLEAAEFFYSTPNGIKTIDYRHQWMDHSQAILRKRWDNAPHQPGTENAPHHIHDGDEAIILPGISMSIQQVLAEITRLLQM